MSKIEFEQNWRYEYVLYYGIGSKWVIHNFPNIFSLLSADPVNLSHMQKNGFSKKNHDFLIENLL